MKKNLILTGMMGVGKTTIGKALSERLKIKFIDVDKVIENQESSSINKIFEKKGEIFFRKIEKIITLKQLENTNCVIALGGGAFINKDIREKVLKSGITIWLDLEIKELFKRSLSSKKRPLLNNVNLEKKLNDIYHQRKDVYNLSNYKINCNAQTKSAVVEKIIEIYESH
ncbi:MAG: shikimate kinase [Candidatus Pelagibacter sp.]|nr:shikimate kinase [Candidatus Pelagibacter sp.]OUW78961.1 MAG: hypothetical protein CBD77_03590 [bacterium TMED217]